MNFDRKPAPKVKPPPSREFTMDVTGTEFLALCARDKAGEIQIRSADRGGVGANGRYIVKGSYLLTPQQEK
jgi:hypothetical protein